MGDCPLCASVALGALFAAISVMHLSECTCVATDITAGASCCFFTIHRWEVRYGVARVRQIPVSDFSEFSSSVRERGWVCDASLNKLEQQRMIQPSKKSRWC